METLPVVGGWIPANTFNIVLLPAPFFPTRAILSRGFTTNEISLNSVTLPKRIVSLSTETILFYTFFRGAKIAVFSPASKFISEAIKSLSSKEIPQKKRKMAVFRFFIYQSNLFHIHERACLHEGHHGFNCLKKSLPLSSTKMNAGKSSTVIFQTASIPNSGYSTHSILLIEL